MFDDNLEKQKFFKQRASSRPLAYCEDCGKPIYSTDDEGLPYRLCYACNHST